MTPVDTVSDERSEQNARTLIESIQLEPDADEPRLVYADSLSERGEPLGELIAVQCALARRADTPGRRKLVKRQNQLLKSIAGAWGDDWKFKQGDLQTTRQTDDRYKDEETLTCQ